jgi:hypothetical protein
VPNPSFEHREPKLQGLGPKLALAGALTGLHWQVVAKEHRLSLLLALEAVQGDGPTRHIQAFHCDDASDHSGLDLYV